MEKDSPTPSQLASRGVVGRLGGLSREHQDRVVDAAEVVGEGDGLDAGQWHRIMDETS
jgi:hypothetical protein